MERMSLTIDNKTKRWKRFALIAFQRFSSIKYTNLFRLLLLLLVLLFVCLYFTYYIVSSNAMNTTNSIPLHSLQTTVSYRLVSSNFHFIFLHRYLCVLTTFYCVFYIWLRQFGKRASRIVCRAIWYFQMSSVRASDDFNAMDQGWHPYIHSKREHPIWMRNKNQL